MISLVVCVFSLDNNQKHHTLVYLQLKISCVCHIFSLASNSSLHTEASLAETWCLIYCSTMNIIYGAWTCAFKKVINYNCVTVPRLLQKGTNCKRLVMCNAFLKNFLFSQSITLFPLMNKLKWECVLHSNAKYSRWISQGRGSLQQKRTVK